MAGITGLGTTFNLPNYTGILHQLSPTATPLFSAIGGLNGGKSTDHTEFEWQTKDLRTRDQRTKTEGADAPTAEERVRGNVSNVVQIHQEQVAVSYTKLAAVGQKSGVNNAELNPVRDELDEQTTDMLTQMVGDINFSFWNGKYHKPANNSEARRTRGLLQAITTNRIVAAGSNLITGATSATDTITSNAHGLTDGDAVVFASTGSATGVTAGRIYYVLGVTTNTFKVGKQAAGPAITLGTGTGIDVMATTTNVLDADTVNELAQTVYDNGGIDSDITAVFAVNSRQKVAISKAFTKTYQEASRTVGGVNVSTIVTDFGTMGVMVDRDVPQDAIVLASLEQMRSRFLNIPGKGHFFAEPLAKTGASDKVQLYGEVGLEYGAETSHGLITGLKV